MMLLYFLSPSRLGSHLGLSPSGIFRLKPFMTLSFFAKPPFLGGFFYCLFFLFAAELGVAKDAKAQGEQAGAGGFLPAFGALDLSRIKLDADNADSDQDEDDKFILKGRTERSEEDKLLPFSPDTAPPRPHKKKRRSFKAQRQPMDPEHFSVMRRRHKKEMPIVSSGNEQKIGRKELDEFVEGTNPLEVLASTTPGANFSSSTPGGSDKMSSFFQMRGFNQNQMGVEMDGIPMGYQDVSGLSGVRPMDIEIQENITSLSASQGSGDIDTPSSSMIGGSLKYGTRDPSDKRGISVGQQFGSYDGYRTFVRGDTGILNHTGTKMTASFLRQAQDLWSGYGGSRRYGMNFKAVQPIGHIGKATLIMDYSYNKEYNANSNTLSMLDTFGYGDRNGGYNNFPPNNPAAASNPAYQKCMASGTASYLCAGGVYGNNGFGGTEAWATYLPALKLDFKLAPSITSNFVAYGQIQDSTFDYTSFGATTPAKYLPNNGRPNYPNGFPLNDVAQYQPGARAGFTQSLHWQPNRRMTVNMGVWYEHVNGSATKAVYPDFPDQRPTPVADINTSDGIPYIKNSLHTDTFLWHIDSKFNMFRGFDFTYGFRSLVQTTKGGNDWTDMSAVNGWGAKGGPLSGNAYANGRMTAANAFLPHFNLDYKFLPKHEFYADIAENMDGYPNNTGMSNPWGVGSGTGSGPQNAFNQGQNQLRPERAWSYVVGYRYNSKAFIAAIDYYHTDYLNRQGSTITYTGNPSNPSYNSFLNLGNEKMDGMDLMATFLPMAFFRFHGLGDIAYMNSFSYMHSAYENDHLPCRGSQGCPSSGFTSIRGNQQVYYPAYMFKTNVNYKYGHFTTNLNVTYNSSRKLTYSNDLSLPGYWTSELTAGYNFEKVGPLRGLKFNFGVSNLFMQEFANGSGTATISGKSNGNLYWTAPREYFGTLSFDL